MVRGLLRRKPWLGVGTAVAVAASAAALTTVAPATAAPPPVMLAAESVSTPHTYPGFTYPTSVTAPSADKPQSKLWFKDGSWWGLLVSSQLATPAFTIHELMADHTWRDTGVVTDTRATSTADALVVGNTLYTASRSTSGSVKVGRFAYTPGSRSWAAQGSQTTITGSGARSITIAVDSASTLWVTYSQGTSIWIAKAPVSTFAWTAPVALNTPDNTVASEDISGIIAFSGKVGVLWSDQQSAAVRFAYHVDGAATDAWTTETVQQNTGFADNHLNIKTLVDDPQGRVFAVIKHSYGDLGEPSSSPLISVLRRSAGGAWTVATAGTVADKLTRPQLAIDQTNNRMYVLMTGPTAGGTIYYKSSSLDSLAFSGGRGDVFMSAPGAVLNNVSTTKDVVSATTGLVAVASDDTNKRYYHAELSLGSGPPPPPPSDTEPPSAPSNVVATAQSPTSVSLAWAASTDNVGVKEYKIYRNGSLLTTTSSVGYTDTAAVASTAYVYGVAAFDAAGNHSSTSTAPSVTTPSAPPSPGGSVAFRAGSTAQVGASTSLVVAKPAGLATGDVMIATVSSRGIPNITPPAGWSLVTSTDNSTTMRQAVYWRAAGASEPASWTFTLSKAKAAVVQVNAYSGVSTTAPVRAFAASVNASGTTVTAPAVTATSGDAVVAVFGTARSSNLTVAATLSKRTQISSVGGSNFVSGAEGDRIATVTGSTGTFTATSVGSAASVGHTLALKPA
jgi:hypothetical protein